MFEDTRLLAAELFPHIDAYANVHADNHAPSAGADLGHAAAPGPVR